MKELFGATRDVVKERYALRTPAGFVASNLPGWTNVTAIVQISPAMGAKLSQVQITLQGGSVGRGNTETLEYFVYVLKGKCQAKVGGKKSWLKAGGYVFIPTQTAYFFQGAELGTELLIFQKPFEPFQQF